MKEIKESDLWSFTENGWILASQVKTSIAITYYLILEKDKTYKAKFLPKQPYNLHAHLIIYRVFQDELSTKILFDGACDDEASFQFVCKLLGI